MPLSVEGLVTEDEQLVSVSVSALLLQRDTVTKETYVFNWGVLIVSEGLLSSWSMLGAWQYTWL